MTVNTYSTEAALLQLTPKQYPNAVRSAGRVRRVSNTIVLASQGSGDTVTLLPLPIGHLFAHGILNGPSLGSTTIQIGDGTTADLYRADATFTAAVATIFGKTVPEYSAPSTTVITPVLTWGTATAPSSGTLSVDFYVTTAD